MSSFFRRHPQPPPALNYRKILVPVIGDPADEPPLRLTALLLAATRGEARLLHVIEVPFQRQLDIEDAEALHRADEILRRGEQLIEGPEAQVRTVTVQARSAGAAIVDDAAEQGADLIVMGLRYKRRLGGAWNAGSTVPYVMRNSLAPVWCLRAETEELADAP